METRDWTNITLKDWYAIQELLEVQDEWTMYNILDYLYDIDSTNMPISELRNYSLAFLNNTEQLDKYKVPDVYDDKYSCNLDLTKVSVAQFIDYNNYIKEEPVKFERILSVFIYPKGATYNDGSYSIEDVQNDILDFPFALVKKLAFFFGQQLTTFTTITLFFLQQEMKEMKTPKTDKMAELINQANSMISEFCPTS